MMMRYLNNHEVAPSQFQREIKIVGIILVHSGNEVFAVSCRRF